MDKLLRIIKGVFPGTEILLLYYCGSVAYGLDDENSDKNVNVVLDNFRGLIHLNLAEYDVFAYSKETFIDRQRFHEGIIPYYRAAADDLLSLDRTLIYLNPSFEETLNELLTYNHKELMLNHLTVELQYGRMRYEISPYFKSHYHIFRFRGMIEHFKKTGIYELVVEEPWKTYMIEYKRNWDNDIGHRYKELLEEQLEYLEQYRNELINNELG